MLALLRILILGNGGISRGRGLLIGIARVVGIGISWLPLVWVLVIGIRRIPFVLRLLVLGVLGGVLPLPLLLLLLLLLLRL